jgi:uncharacterized protein YcfJ
MTTYLILLMTLAACGSAFAAAYFIAQQRVSKENVPPQILIEEGAFQRMAANEMGSPDNLIQSMRSSSGIPMDGDLTGHIGTQDECKISDEPTPFQKALWGAAAADALIPPGELWLRWSSVDENVFKAFSHLSHEQIGGVADLLNLVDAKSYAIESNGFLNSLVGHIGEWKTLENLTNAGLAVSMPFNSNHPGIDMWVGDTGLNVKTVADASTLGEHFANYPDIGVVVPYDAANIPADALHLDAVDLSDPEALVGAKVIVDGALSHAETVRQAQEAIDVLQSPGVDFHIPYITIAVSSFREIKLISKGHTDFMRATKNVATDAVTVGGGGLAGMKLGAGLGTFIGGPIGTVVGGAVGGIAGAIGGRMVGNKIKHGPLEEAQQKYETAYQRCIAKKDELVKAATSDLEKEGVVARKRLLTSAEEAKNDTYQKLGELKAALSNQKYLGRETAKYLLEIAQSRIITRINNQQSQLNTVLPRWAQLFAGLFFPHEIKSIKQLNAEHLCWTESKTRLLENWDNDPESTAKCFDLILAQDNQSLDAKLFIERIMKARRVILTECINLQQNAVHAMLQQRTKVVSDLKDYAKRIQDSLESEIKIYLSAVKQTRSEYEAELRRAGVSV